MPGVLAVITAETLKTVNLAWMPTLAGDVQMVLADGKVLFQNQEVAFVVATDRYAADDGINEVEVEYEPLPVVIDPFKAMDADAPVLREDLAGKTTGAHGPRKHHNHVFEWTVGDKDLTDAAFRKAEVTIKEMISYHRTHPSPLETCQCVCSFDKIRGELTIWGTFQAPHVIRTVVALIAKIPEHKIHVISPDIGGGFGNKVGAYPGYICAAVASIVTGKPVKWVEDRIENLTATSFARDYHMTTEIAATKEGKVTGLRVHVLADHGAFDACADPSKWPAGFFNIVTGSYDFPIAHLAVDGIYTNKAPGGVAYRCSFRVTEAAYCIERGMDILAQKLGMDPAELRLKNFIKPEQFPYHSALGWEYDSGDYHTAMKKMMETVDYAGLRKEQAAKRAAFKRGETREIMGLGVSFFTEIVGAGPSKNCDILGIAMFDSCEIRLHPTGAGIARVGTKSQGQGHETTWAQIIATEIGIPADNIMVEEGNTDTAPYGLGTYGSRSTPVAGAAIAMAARKIKAKAQMIAAYKLEVHEDDLEWDIDGFRVKGLPEKTMSMKDICWAAYNSVPPGMEPGLEAVSYYDPPNMTYPFGAYICVMDIDVDTGVYKIRRFYALDDCGTRINPMIIEGQVHGGLTEAFAIAMGQEIRYDDDRQCGDRLVHGFLHADRGRDAALGDRLHGDAVAAPPDRRQGRRRKPECRRRAGLLQRRQRRLLVPRLDPHPDAARLLAQLEGGEGVGSVRVMSVIVIRGASAKRSSPDIRATIAGTCDRCASRPGMKRRKTLDHENPRRDRASAGRVRLYRRRRTRDRDLADATAEASAAAGRRGGRRQDRGGQGAGRGARHRTDPPAMLRGARSVGRALRMELPAPVAGDPGASRRGCRRHRGPDLLGKIPAGTAAAGRDPPRQAAGAADRRDRPRRRRVRGVPARTAVGFPGLDPRTRHHHGDHDSACGADLERHARTVGRAAPPLPLSLCRLSRRRSRGAHHHGADRRRRRLAVAADRAAWSKASARRNCARCRASPRRWTGRRRWSGSTCATCTTRPKWCTRP